MLGDSLLVAPIFNDKGIAKYYLPEGRWTSFLTGEGIGRWKMVKEYHDYLSIPLYVRPCSIVAVGATDSDAVYEYEEGVTYRVYQLEEGGDSLHSGGWFGRRNGGYHFRYKEGWKILR